MESTVKCLRVLMFIKRELGITDRKADECLFIYIGKDLINLGLNACDYKGKVEEDGILYITYADFNVFGRTVSFGD
jgi:hypothetical protein